MNTHLSLSIALSVSLMTLSLASTVRADDESKLIKGDRFTFSCTSEAPTGLLGALDGSVVVGDPDLKASKQPALIAGGSIDNIFLVEAKDGKNKNRLEWREDKKGSLTAGAANVWPELDADGNLVSFKFGLAGFTDKKDKAQKDFGVVGLSSKPNDSIIQYKGKDYSVSNCEWKKLPRPTCRATADRFNMTQPHQVYMVLRKGCVTQDMNSPRYHVLSYSSKEDGKHPRVELDSRDDVGGAEGLEAALIAFFPGLDFGDERHWRNYVRLGVVNDSIDAAALLPDGAEKDALLEKAKKNLKRIVLASPH